jgi:hypothetical protein
MKHKCVVCGLYPEEVAHICGAWSGQEEGNIMLVCLKKRKMEAPIVVGEMS